VSLSYNSFYQLRITKPVYLKSLKIYRLSIYYLMRYYLLTAALCSPLLLSAQNRGTTQILTDSTRIFQQLIPKKTTVSFGIKLGANYSNTNFNQGSPKPLAPIATTWKTGFIAGFLVQIALLHKLALQQEYLFSQVNGEIRNEGVQYTLHYLSLPLLLKYTLVPRVTIVAGPQFDLLIQAQQKISDQTFNITHDTEERGIGATAGLEVSLSKSLSLSARYLQGLNHIGIGQRSAVREFKLQSVQLTLDARF
jgi:opacity protein-like surface antigen